MNMVDSSTPQGTWYLKKWYSEADHDNNIFTDPLTISSDGISLNLMNITIIINHDSTNNTYTGSIFLEETDRRFSYSIDQIQWNNDTGQRNLVFRINTFKEQRPTAYEWYSGKIVEGIFVGRFSHLNHPSTQPRFGDPPYSNHVTGWNREYIDQKDIVPRVYDIVLDNADYQRYRPGNSQRKCRGLLRIDRLKNGHFIGRMKVYATFTSEGWDSRGEELEYDLEIDRWDGDNLHFIRRHHFVRRENGRDIVEDWMQEFDGTTKDRLIFGQYRHTSGNNVGPNNSWHGERAQILTYGLNPKDTRERERWQLRTRQRLIHLTMAGNPTPIVDVSSPTLPPFIQGRDTRSWATKIRHQNNITYVRCGDIQVVDTRLQGPPPVQFPLGWQYFPLSGCVRDDNPPQNPSNPIRNSPNDYYILPFRIKELWFRYRFANFPYNINQEIDHLTHAWLAAPSDVPLELTSERRSEYRGRRYPAVICLNGHGGSGWRTIAPYWGYGGQIGLDIAYYYGDSFARRGNVVVLAIDMTHRRTEESIAYHDQGAGDLPGQGISGLQLIPISKTDSLDIDNNVYQDLQIIDHNETRSSIKPHEYIASDWEQDGERAWDIIQGLNYLLTLPYVDHNCIIVAGLSMGGEMAAKVAALDPRITMVISAGWSPDSGVHHCKGFPSSTGEPRNNQSPLGHWCHAWIYANNLEYVDTSDYHALIAPRPLIVETGNIDTTYTSPGSIMRPYYFSGDKTVTRRSRMAFQDSVKDQRFIHFMFSGGHEFHFGDLYPISGARPSLFNNPQYMYVPSSTDPTYPNDIEWQINSNTISTGQTVFDFIMKYGCRRTRVYVGDPFPYEVYCLGDCSLRSPYDRALLKDPIDWLDRDVTVFLSGRINGLILDGTAVKMVTVTPGTVFKRYTGKTKQYSELNVIESEKGEGFNGLEGCAAALQNEGVIKGIILKEGEIMGILSGKKEFK
jgi:pimeloyl-ACP methyl ester carboxylesterase